MTSGDERSLASSRVSAAHADRSRARRGGTSVALGSLLGVGGSAVSIVGGFALVLVATRLLGASGSGGLFVAVAISTVLTNVCKLGTDTSLVRFVALAVTQHRPHEVGVLTRRAVLASLVVSVAVGVLLFVFAARVAALVYSTPGAQPGPTLVRMVAVFLPLATVTLVLLAVLRGFGRVAGFAMVEQILKPVLRPMLVVLLCLGGASVQRATLAWLLPIVPGVLLTGWLVTRVLAGSAADGLRDAGDDRSATTTVGQREFWGFAAPRALGGTLEILAPWVGVLLLSATTGSQDAGVFTAAARVVTAGTMVLVAMRLALGPHLSAIYARHDLDGVSRLHQHSTVWAVLASFPFFLAVAFFPEATLSVFGSDFRAGAGALVILVAANLVNVAVGNVQSIVLMSGRSRWNLANTAAALALQVLAGLALIPFLGLTGAAIGLGLGVLCNNLLSLRQASARLGVTVWSHGVVVALGLTIGICVPVGIAVRVWLGHSIGDLIVAAVVDGLAVVVAVALSSRHLALGAGWRVMTADLGSVRGAP